jgi:hypothetical protein
MVVTNHINQIVTHKFNRLLLYAAEHHVSQVVAVLAALRGPDPEYQEIKHRFTTPIRCWVYDCTPKDLGSNGMDTEPPPFMPKTVEEWYQLAAEAREHRRDSDVIDPRDTNAMDHYFDHIDGACQQIGILVSEKKGGQ